MAPHGMCKDKNHSKTTVAPSGCSKALLFGFQWADKQKKRSIEQLYVVFILFDWFDGQQLPYSNSKVSLK